MQRINVYQLANSTFPEIKVEKIDYLGNGVVITGEVLLYGDDINTPLIEGYGQLRLIDSGSPFSDPGVFGQYINHSHYQLPEENEEKIRLSDPKFYKMECLDGPRFLSKPSFRIYRRMDYYINYWTRYFSGHPYVENKRSPFLSSMYAEGRWITFDCVHFGYIELTQLHGLFIEHYEHTPASSINLLFETNTGHYLSFHHKIHKLKIEFIPLTKPE